MTRPCKRSALSAATAAAIVGVLSPGHAAAYCAYGPEGTGLTTLRILVHPALASEMVHPNGTVWTSAEVDRAVWHSVSAMNESANADIPFLYFDYINDPTCTWLDTDCFDGVQPWTACGVPGAVVIVPSNCMATQVTPTGTTPAGAIFHISRNPGFSNPPGNPVDLNHGLFVDPAGGYDSFENTVLHEVGHAMGLMHPWDGGPYCDPPALPWPNASCPLGISPPIYGCSVMASDSGLGYSGDIYGPDDVNGFQFVWGDRAPPVVRNFEDADLTTASFGELPMTDVDVAGYLSASSRPWEWRSSVTMVGLRPDSNIYVRAFAWNWDGSVTWTADLNPGILLNGPVGAAETTTTRVVSATPARGTGDARHYRRRIFDMRSALTSPGTGWTTVSTNPAAGAADDTYTAGVASAFHSPSGAVIHAIRDDTAQVILLSRGTSWSSPMPTGVRSYVAPAIACAGSTCMLAVVEPMPPAPGPTSTAARLQWMEFTWTQTGGAVPINGGLRTSSWSMTGSISAAAVHRAAGGDDFVVTSSFIQMGGSFGTGNWGSRTFAYRHTAGTTTMVLLLPQISETAGAFSFSPVGGTSVYAESFLITP